MLGIQVIINDGILGMETLGNHSTPLFNPEERCILLFGSETSKQVIASMNL